MSVDVLMRVLETAASQLEVRTLLGSRGIGIQTFLDLRRIRSLSCFLTSRNFQAQKKSALHSEDDHEIVFTILYLLVVVSKVLQREPREKEELYALVRRLNRTRCTTQEGNSLLHLAVDQSTPVNDFHTRNLCQFPCAKTAK